MRNSLASLAKIREVSSRSRVIHVQSFAMTLQCLTGELLHNFSISQSQGLSLFHLVTFSITSKQRNQSRRGGTITSDARLEAPSLAEAAMSVILRANLGLWNLDSKAMAV